MDEEASVVHSQPIVEDFDLPNIREMKSQYEKQSVSIPLPNLKSPAALAKEKEKEKRKKEKSKELVPVNSNSSSNDITENYQIELNKLKNQFENENTTPPMPATRSRSTSRTKSSLKGNSSEIKNAKTTLTNENTSSPEIVKSSDVINDTDYEIEMISLKKMFNKASIESLTNKPMQNKSKKGTRRTTSSTSFSSDTSSSMTTSTKDENEAISNESPTKNIVKSSEPLHEEMIGEESLKDRLLRYKRLTSLNETVTSVPKKSLNRKRSSFSSSSKLSHLSPVESKTTDKKQLTESSEKQESNENPEIVRSSIAGEKEQVNYQLDLKQTKALFENLSSEAFDRSSDFTRRSSIRSSSSRQRSLSSVSSRSSTKSVYSVRSRDDSEINSSLSKSTSDLREMVDTADVVRPLPAGTKEVVEVQPSVSIKNAKSIFERGSSGNLKNVDFSRPKRTSLKSAWLSSNDSGTGTKKSVVKEGSFVESNGIVRPPAAGTKEQPDYQLDKDALKAKMAMFQKENTNEYKPRNNIKKDEKKVATEIVNQKTNDENEEKEEFVTSIDQKAARSVFENPKEESTPAPKTVNDIVPASNLNAAKGVFSNNKTVENFDLQLSPKEEEEEVIEDVTEKVSEQLEKTKIAEVPDEKATVQDTSSSSSDSSSEADSLEVKQEEVDQEETIEKLQTEEDSQQQL